MSQNKLVINSMINSVKRMGTGSGGTRNISGNSNAIVELENELADFHLKEKAIVFSSGYVANESTISTLLNLLGDSVVFSDEKNHASIISGIKKSKALKEIFKHNDLNHLEALIKKYPEKKKTGMLWDNRRKSYLFCPVEHETSPRPLCSCCICCSVFVVIELQIGRAHV